MSCNVTMATIGNVCGICGEEVIGSMQVHLMSKCKGYGQQSESGGWIDAWR